MPHLVATLIYLSHNYSYYIRGDRSPLTCEIVTGLVTRQTLDNSESDNYFCNMITENSLFQMKSVISNTHGSLLDLVFTAEPYLVDEPVASSLIHIIQYLLNELISVLCDH